jgi:hypothetical protein
MAAVKSGTGNIHIRPTAVNYSPEAAQTPYSPSWRQLQLNQLNAAPYTRSFS